VPRWIRDHDTLALALAAAACLALAGLVNPDVAEDYGPLRLGLRDLFDRAVPAKAAGLLRLLALTAGLAVVALGHARLDRGPGGASSSSAARPSLDCGGSPRSPAWPSRSPTSSSTAAPPRPSSSSTPWPAWPTPPRSSPPGWRSRPSGSWPCRRRP